jgi:RND family efflux transporter MFP subunit
MPSRVFHVLRYRVLPILGGLLVVAGAAYGAVRLHQRKNQLAAETAPGPILPRPVKLVKTHTTDVRDTLAYPGTVKASRTARLAFRVGGPLVEVNITLGQPVSEGDVLMRIDPRDYRDRVAAADSRLAAAKDRLAAMERGDRPEDIAVQQAKLEAAKARLVHANLVFARTSKLYEEKVIPKADYDQVESAHTVAAAAVAELEQELVKAKAGARAEDIAAAKADIRGLETALKIARDQLADTELRAPFDGVVTSKLIENHEMVSVGRPVLDMQSISDLEIDVNVPEIELVHETDWHDFAAVTRFSAIPGRVFPVHLKEFSTKADPSTRTYVVTFSLVPPKDANILPGMTAEVSRQPRGNTPAKTTVLTVPAQAVLANSDGVRYVWVLPEGAEQAERRVVDCGGLIGSQDMRIRSGLQPGERVVLGGAHFITEHTLVRPLPEPH